MEIITDLKSTVNNINIDKKKRYSKPKNSSKIIKKRKIQSDNNQVEVPEVRTSTRLIKKNKKYNDYKLY